MAHEIQPTGWNPSICANCGFPSAQHAVLYGTAEQGETENHG